MGSGGAAGSISKRYFYGDLCKKNVSIFFPFSVIFNHNFILYTDFTHIAGSNPANDDVTNSITHRVFNTDFIIIFLCSFCSQNWWKKLALMTVFNMIS